MTEPDSFAAALISEGPHAALPPESRIFAPFIGSWDLVVSWFDASGALSRRQDGEWHFAWILEGRAIQDVWIVPPRHARVAASDLYEYGTSLRFFDPAIDAWQSTWIGPMHRLVRSFIAHRAGDQVVLETVEGTSPRMRWSFADIAADAFTWRNEAWKDGAWRLQQAFEARRRRA
ncbi:hypothetical protein [Plastoroseomonas hellenica]|uniref:hypothetical protein n=1 Tax=Plastoroseomonas hellenica TaxID=2687306 RepID=UPI001BADD05F|nr:hypothetical protein [Plastoroseomonas hellenica]MBR0641692.1 hypothetical protein [Plastoroseomonas hellenica]